MSCENQVGVKNVLVSFRNCETGAVTKFVSHKMAGDELPTVRTCAWVNEPLTNGYNRRRQSNASIQITLIRNERIPIANYQGCAAVDIQIEYFNGMVYTGINGTVGGEDGSDSHEVTMDITFETLDEMLPGTALAA